MYFDQYLKHNQTTEKNEHPFDMDFLLASLLYYY